MVDCVPEPVRPRGSTRRELLTLTPAVLLSAFAVPSLRQPLLEAGVSLSDRTPQGKMEMKDMKVTGCVAQGTRHTIGRFDGVSSASARLSVPDGSVGSVSADGIASVSSPVRRMAVPDDPSLRERPNVTSPVVTVVDRRDVADLLGTFDEYVLLKPRKGRAGWTSAPSNRRR